MKAIQITRRGVLSSVLCLALTLLGAVGCAEEADTEVVLYTSVDQPIAAKAVAAFERAHPGVRVRLVTDSEAMKSVGLAEKLRAEKANPIAHVWWGNEVFHTIALANEGYFEPLAGDEVNQIEPQFKDGQLRWAGCGLRARVLAVSESAGPTAGSLQDLADSRFKGRVALARPLAGTTGGHVAALYAFWGEQKADAFFASLKANGAILLGSNSEVARQVGNGNLLLGLTDNDDVFNVQRAGGELWQVVPDQSDTGIGTLAIPTTVALVKRDASPSTAKQLAAFLLSDANERLLLDEHFAAFSVRASPERLRTMAVSYEDVARQMTTAPKRVADLFDGR
jgi:iron(III) transport system substrate-binding protein